MRTDKMRSPLEKWSPKVASHFFKHGSTASAKLLEKQKIDIYRNLAYAFFWPWQINGMCNRASDLLLNPVGLIQTISPRLKLYTNSTQLARI